MFILFQGGIFQVPCSTLGVYLRSPMRCRCQRMALERARASSLGKMTKRQAAEAMNEEEETDDDDDDDDYYYYFFSSHYYYHPYYYLFLS